MKVPIVHAVKMKRQQVVKKTHPRSCDVCAEMERDGYPKLSLHEECALETSEKSGMGSMGWKEA